MNVFKKAVRWWIFLPFAPIILAVLLEYWAEVFHHLELYRMYNVTRLLQATDTLVLLPYMFLAYLSFPFQLGLSFGSAILAFSFSAGLLSLMLYGVNLLAVKRMKHRT